MEHQIRDERARQFFAVPGVQKRHVNHADVYADILGQHPPLTLNLLIVPAQPVNAENIQQIARLHLLQHFFVLWPVKILPGLLVDVCLLGIDQFLPKGNQLALLILILA